jgi:hypothetical protein
MRKHYQNFLLFSAVILILALVGSNLHYNMQYTELCSFRQSKLHIAWDLLRTQADPVSIDTADSTLPDESRLDDTGAHTRCNNTIFRKFHRKTLTLLRLDRSDRVEVNGIHRDKHVLRWLSFFIGVSDIDYHLMQLAVIEMRR